MRYIISPVCSRSNPGISPWLNVMRKTSKRRYSEGVQIRCPRNFFFKENNLYDSMAFHNIIKLRLRFNSLDLDVLTLIYPAQPRTVNHLSVLWRSGSDDGSRTTSSAKSRDEMMRSPKPNTIFSRIEGQSRPDRH